MIRKCAIWLLGGFLISQTGLGEVTLDLKTALVKLDEAGRVVSIRSAAGEEYAAAEAAPAFDLVTKTGIHAVESVRREGNAVAVRFAGGAAARFTVQERAGFALFTLDDLTGAEGAIRLRAFSVQLRSPFDRAGMLNACYCGPFTVALMAAEVNVHAHPGQYGGTFADREGCSHTFKQVSDNVKSGRFAACFAATSKLEDKTGYSVQGRQFTPPLDLTGCKALRAWVHGDGKGEALKIQLIGGPKGYRDDVLVVDFQGWRQVTLDKPSGNTLDYAQVAGIRFYFNGLPSKETVECRVDRVEAIVERGGREEVIGLEDFEDPASCLWQASTTTLCVETYDRQGIRPVRFGLLVCPRADFPKTIQEFEAAAGLPSPRPDGVWIKTSPWVKRSYFFLTRFKESEFDQALAIARRGGFDMILIDQGSWCKSTGHYPINTNNFPDGLPALQRTIQRFKDAGFKVGLHFLGPSIYPPDEYLAPKPDPRLVKDAFTELAGDVDEKADMVPTPTAPGGFPGEDGGYEGSGAVLQIGDELILYGARSMEPPFGFIECRRGYLGTTPAPHKKGDRIAHLLKSYGYYLFDVDSSLLDEVSANFAKVANACKIDMIYFDGSERMQGGAEAHWYYHGKFQRAFYDKLENKNILIQGSSLSHFSWHHLARSASADGHGDLKGYLDERSGWWRSLELSLMPLDIGWYYGYDPEATLDEYEYILGATIGYDSSMSFQVSPTAWAAHPIGGEILDLIARYERLRLSGRVPEEMRERLRIDPSLAGAMPPEQRAKVLDKRREYRLLGEEGKEVFQRVVYEPWREVQSHDAKETEWTIQVKEGPARVGVQMHVRSSLWLLPGASYNDPNALVLEAFDDVSAFKGGTLKGVTQKFESTTDDPRIGSRRAVYTATSSLHSESGWSSIGKSFDPPLDLSWHKAIGFWMQGDGKGGKLKLQLTDGAHACDYYIANDFTGWRYQQLARRESDPVDYTQVKRLVFYYNVLPAQTTVSCGIDDVKALRAVDRQFVLNPRVTVGATTVSWNGPMEDGAWMIGWPGERTRIYGVGTKQQDDLAPEIVLPSGEHKVKVDFDGTMNVPLRVRLTLQPPERHEARK